MSVIVIELPELVEDDVLPPELDVLAAVTPLEEDPEPVPAETAEPTEIGSAVMTPSLGAVTTVSCVFFLAVE